MIFTPYTTNRIFHDQMARPVLRIFFVDLYFTIHPCIIAYNDAKRWALYGHTLVVFLLWVFLSPRFNISPGEIGGSGWEVVQCDSMRYGG